MATPQYAVTYIRDTINLNNALKTRLKLESTRPGATILLAARNFIVDGPFTLKGRNLVLLADRFDGKTGSIELAGLQLAERGPKATLICRELTGINLSSAGSPGRAGKDGARGAPGLPGKDSPFPPGPLEPLALPATAELAISPIKKYPGGNGTPGGPGENGENGGAGGQGGDLTIVFVANKIIGGLNSAKIAVPGGPGGPGGRGGPGGFGGPGGQGDPPGRDGPDGRDGIPGEDGFDGLPGSIQCTLVSEADYYAWLNKLTDKWANYRLRAAEYYFRACNLCDPARSTYRALADYELCAVLKLDPQNEKAKTYLSLIRNNQNIYGQSRNADVVPNFPSYEHTLTDYTPLVQGLFATATSLLAGTTTLEQMRVGVANQIPHLEVLLRSLVADYDAAQLGLKIQRDEQNTAAKRIEDIRNRIRERESELRKQDMWKEVAGLTIFAVTTAIIAIATAGAGTGPEVAFATKLLAFAPDVAALIKPAFGSIPEKDQQDLIKSAVGLKDYASRGFASTVLPFAVSFAKMIADLPDPKDDDELRKLVREAVEAAHAKLLADLRCEQAAAASHAAGLRVAQARTDIELAKTQLNGLVTDIKYLELVAFNLIRNARSYMDLLTQTAFKAARAVEIYTLADMSGIVRADYGYVHPDREQDWVEGLLPGAKLLGDYTASWASFVDILQLRYAYDRYFSSSTWVQDQLFMSVKDPDVLANFRQTQNLELSVGLNDLPSTRAEAKVNYVRLSLTGVVASVPVLSCKVRHLGQYAMRKRDGSIINFVLNPTKTILQTAKASLQYVGGVIANDPSTLEFWGRGIAATWSIEIEPDVMALQHIDLSQLSSIEIEIGYQAFLQESLQPDLTSLEAPATAGETTSESAGAAMPLELAGPLHIGSHNGSHLTALSAARIGLAGFDFELYDQQFIHRPSAAAVNDAQAYGVHVEAVQPLPNQACWKVIGVHHLTPDENRSRHNAYVDILDEHGQRIRQSHLSLGWTWEGKSDGPAQPKQFDKPADEPATDVPIEGGMTVSMWMEGDGISEKVTGLHTRHPDEPGSNGGGNTYGHHSYFVVFQHAIGNGNEPPPTEPFRFLHWPTDHRGELTQRFGENPDCYPGFPGHEGVDFRALEGDPIYCVAPGVVSYLHTAEMYAADHHNYGVYVCVQHADGYVTTYAHLKELKVTQDQHVEEGQVLGLADHTGHVIGAPGDHLHLTLQHAGESALGYPHNIIDPMPFLRPLMPPAPVEPPGGSDVIQVRVAQKLGLNCNAPIDGYGRITPRVADPRLIGDTGVGWVRLNFIARPPFAGPDDPTPGPDGVTWIEAYRRIISGLRSQGLQIYGLVGAEAVPTDPGNQFRDATQGVGSVDNAWIRSYAANFRRIVELFYQDVPIFESFNEPNDWHRTEGDPMQWRQAWIHPDWFAIMLQAAYDAVCDLPVTLVSGPLHSSEDGNGAAQYLPLVYQAGKDRYGWGQPGCPVPFDGIGFHPYLKGNPDDPAAVIPAMYRQYMTELRSKIMEHDAASKPVYVSEIGWQNSEDRQPACMEVGLSCALEDPSVALCFWYGMQDEPGKPYGLYRCDGLTPAHRKPIYDRFVGLANKPGVVPAACPRPRQVKQALDIAGAMLPAASSPASEIAASTALCASSLTGKSLADRYDYLAPDGSEIRLLPELTGGGLCHCLLPAGKASKPVRHKTVEEIWYFLSGDGEVWRKQGDYEDTVTVKAGVSLTIPVRTAFQFRNTGATPLCLIIVTIPRWPGKDEAEEVEGKWGYCQ